MRGKEVRSGKRERRVGGGKGMRGRKENFFIYTNVGNRLSKERTDFLPLWPKCLWGNVEQCIWSKSLTQYWDPGDPTCLDSSLCLKSPLCSPALESSHFHGWAWVIQPRYLCPCEMQDTSDHKLRKYRELPILLKVTWTMPPSASDILDLTLQVSRSLIIASRTHK